MTLGTGLVVEFGDQHVGWLDISMDDPFLMGMLDCPADSDEQLQDVLSYSGCAGRNTQ